jgi:hypothetical protein
MTAGGIAAGLDRAIQQRAEAAGVSASERIPREAVAPCGFGRIDRPWTDSAD